LEDSQNVLDWQKNSKSEIFDGRARGALPGNEGKKIKKTKKFWNDTCFSMNHEVITEERGILVAFTRHFQQA
jgi:hypothetical protein